MLLVQVMPIDLRRRGAGAAPAAPREDERKRRHQDRANRARAASTADRAAACGRAHEARAPLTIRMAFFADSAISKMIPIWV